MSTFQVKGNNGTTVRVQTQPKKVFRVDGSLRGPKGGPGPRGTDGQDGADGRDIELQSNATHVQWRKVGDDTWIDLVDISDLAGQDGADGTNGTNGVDGADGTNGEDGADGREVQLQSDGTYIQWRYSGDASWTNLVSIASLKGADGADGTNGTDGADGYTPVKGVDYFDGADGDDGREVEFQKGATYIQWRYVGDAGWTNLVALADLKGADGSDGTNGSDGADGIDGRTTLSGAGAPAPSLGEDGDFYINTSTYGIYGPKTAGAWGSPTSLVGPAGSGTGDMLASVYDPDGGARQVAFKDELGGGGVTDHGALTGLGDDDHTQYHNNTRGDARYYTKTQVDSSLGGKSDTGHTHDSTDVTDFDSAVSGNTDVAANTSARHTHSNKAVLDATTASFTTAKDSKLSGIETGAEVNEIGTADIANFETTTELNARDTANRNRANHTGSQAISTVSGLQDALNGKAASSHTHPAADLTATGIGSTKFLRGDNTWQVPTNTTYTAMSQVEAENSASTTARLATGQRIAQGALKATESAINAKADSSTVTAHTSNTSNPHSVTKAQVGLSNANNTSDANKPVSTATQTALDTKTDRNDMLRFDRLEKTSGTGFDLGITGIQGVAYDGTYYYVTTSTNLYKYNSSGTLVTSRSNAGDGNTHKYLGDCVIVGTKLFVASCNFGTSGPWTSYVVEFNASDLTYVTEHFVYSGRCDTVTYNDGHFWMPTYDHTVRQYDASWSFVAEHDMPIDDFIYDNSDYGLGFDGATWIGNNLILNVHAGVYPNCSYILYFNGTHFVSAGQPARPQYCTQGLDYDATTNTIIAAERAPTNRVSILNMRTDPPAITQWREIGRTTLTSSSSSLTVSNIPPFRYLKLEVSAIAIGGRITVGFKFNNDSGANYARNRVYNLENYYQAQGLNYISISATNEGLTFITANINNIANQRKIGIFESVNDRGPSPDTEIPAKVSATGSWTNTTDAINRIDAIMTAGTGIFDADSEIIVYGHN